MTLYEANCNYDDDVYEAKGSHMFMKVKYVVLCEKIVFFFISNLLSKLAQAVTIMTCIGCFFRLFDAVVSFYWTF